MTTQTKAPTLERGSASVMFVCLLAFVILPVVGLAIDGSVAFIVSTRLSATIDAAALAAARSLNVGLTIDSQTDSAIETAQAYFEANFPDGFLGATAQMDIPSVKQSTAAVRTVTITGSAKSPLYFLRLFGGTSATVTAKGQASRRDANIMFVLDRSGSMQDSGSCEPMKDAAQSLVNRFANQRDRAGLVTFLGSASVDFKQRLNFKPDLVDLIKTLRCSGNTGTAQALSLAHKEFLDSSTGKLLYPGAQNVILLFTDGLPNGVTGQFPVKGTCTPPPSTSPKTTIGGFLAGSPTGVFSADSIPLSSTNVSRASTGGGCQFTTSTAKVANDISEIPLIDLDNNHTQGYKKTVDSGPIPVTGKMVSAASWNAADDAAYQIRRDGILIYCIGEGDVDDVLLKRIANTPDSKGFDDKLPVGKYYYVPGPSQIAAAFNAIASQVLFLSQ